MRVFYHQAEGGNVGDDINAVLWERLLPEFRALNTAQWLVGIGTSLDERVNTLAGRRIIMGSGLRPARSLPQFSGDLRFAAVRGTLTAERLALGDDVALGDPGFLIGRIYSPPQSHMRERNGPVALVPHVYSERWSKISDTARDAGLEVISPTLPWNEFLDALSRCSRVYCESLHAAIFAETLRIPWARVRMCSHYYEGEGVADFKWRDAFSIVGVDRTSVIRNALIPVRRTWMRPAQAIAERRLVRALRERRDDESQFALADAGRLEERIEQLHTRVQGLRDRALVERLPQAAPMPLRRDREWSPTVLILPKASENPFVSRFSGALERMGATVDDFTYTRALTRRYDVLHLHWPDSHLMSGSFAGSAFKHARLALLAALLRYRGTRVVWMLHNLQPHDRNHWLSRRLFALWFPKACTHVIALTAFGLQSARSLYPVLSRKHSAIIPHGHYRGAYARPSSKADCRDQLGLPRDRFTFLFFGSVRVYKNVPLLIEIFRSLEDRDVQLVIAGQPGHGISADELSQMCAGDDRISLKLEFIPDDAVPQYFGAADAVVLPFDSILNSGSVLLAVSFNRVVLAPSLGALPEIQALVGEHWLHLYEGSLSPEMLTGLRKVVPPDDAEVDLAAFEWNSIADRTLELYRRDVGGQPQDDAVTRGASEEGSYERRAKEYF